MSPGKENKQKQNPLFHLIAGGCAGFVESTICHPLDTVKTRMQLRTNTSREVQQAASKFPSMRLRQPMVDPGINKRILSELASHLKPASATYTAAVARTMPATMSAAAPLGPFGTARQIVQKEGFLALYKGLTAVQTGIIPKMAVRYTSFELYRDGLDHIAGHHMRPSAVNFMAGLGAGLTEAAFITPTEVCKIRMMGQSHSLLHDQPRKYTNVVQTAVTVAREEGIGALYKGVAPTMMRNGTNGAVNFAAYNAFKKKVIDWQGTDNLEHWQSLLIGGITGGMGPMVTNPLDVVKTRLQKQVITPGTTPKYNGMLQSIIVIAREEGILALGKGLTPRLMRLMPGQAITFMTYEAVSEKMIQFGIFQ